jgi:uncharacterized protein (TIGR03437 family)
LTIRAKGVGASAVSGVKLDPSGNVVSQSNGLSVTFDGKAAPLIYTSAYQTNLIVPYEVAGKASTVIQVLYVTVSGTRQTTAWTLAVAASAPGIFTIDSRGLAPTGLTVMAGSRSRGLHGIKGGFAHGRPTRRRRS